jgi:hypothetical protein
MEPNIAILGFETTRPCKRRILIATIRPIKLVFVVGDRVLEGIVSIFRNATLSREAGCGEGLLL